MEPMYYIGLDVHKQKISYCVKDSSGKIYAEGCTRHPPRSGLLDEKLAAISRAGRPTQHYLARRFCRTVTNTVDGIAPDRNQAPTKSIAHALYSDGSDPSQTGNQ